MNNISLNDPKTRLTKLNDSFSLKEKKMREKERG